MCEVPRVYIEIDEELERAVNNFPKFRSMHEGYAILLEGVDELWDSIKKNQPIKARVEAIQVAAMAIRFINDCCDN